MEEAKKRTHDLNLDLIRGLAAFLVLSVHFFLNNGYYATPMLGKKMLLLTVVRTGFMVCVPLFLLLSGFLCHRKKWSGRYYVGIFRVLFTYGFVTLVCLIFKCVYQGVPFRITWAGKELLAYTGAPYAWYVEMYLGLFLFIPFLNGMYHSMDSQKKKLALVLTLMGLTALPALCNLNHHILPAWWMQIYPVTYYILGAYLNEYPLKWSWKVEIPALALVILAGGVYNYVRCYGEVFRWEDYNNWYGPGIMVSSVLVFSLLRKVKLDRVPRPVSWCIRKAAELSLAIYLVSWCYDQLFYPMLAARVPNMPDRMWAYFVIVPAVYLCSALTAQVVEWCRMGLTWVVNRCIPPLKLN